MNTKLEKQILTKALFNHNQEKRSCPHWRVAVKSTLPEFPREAGSKPLNPCLYVRSLGDISNQLSSCLGKFNQRVQKILGGDIEPGATNTMAIEVFEALGYVYALSRKHWTRSDAESMRLSWEKKGLDCFLIPYLESGADLFSGELLPGTPSENTPQHRTRPMTSITLNTDDKAIKQYQRAALSLEKAGLAIRVEGSELGCPWDGLNLTQAGVLAAKDCQMTDTKTEYTPQKVQCPGCKGIFHETTESFVEDAVPKGKMFRLLTKYQNAGWNVLPHDAQGENLVCPSCEERYVSEETHRIAAGCLID